jgi:hypothetical protein
VVDKLFERYGGALVWYGEGGKAIQHQRLRELAYFSQGCLVLVENEVVAPVELATEDSTPEEREKSCVSLRRSFLLLVFSY